MHGSGRGGMKSMIAATDEKPKVTLSLLKRVLNYAHPRYKWRDQCLVEAVDIPDR